MSLNVTLKNETWTLPDSKIAVEFESSDIVYIRDQSTNKVLKVRDIKLFNQFSDIPSTFPNRGVLIIVKNDSNVGGKSNLYYYNGVTIQQIGANIRGILGSGTPMNAEVYDTDFNGKVDMAEDSEMLGGKVPSQYMYVDDEFDGGFF